MDVQMGGPTAILKLNIRHRLHPETTKRPVKRDFTVESYIQSYTVVKMLSVKFGMMHKHPSYKNEDSVMKRKLFDNYRKNLHATISCTVN